MDFFAPLSKGTAMVHMVFTISTKTLRPLRLVLCEKGKTFAYRKDEESIS